MAPKFPCACLYRSLIHTLFSIFRLSNNDWRLSWVLGAGVGWGDWFFTGATQQRLNIYSLQCNLSVQLLQRSWQWGRPSPNQNGSVWVANTHACAHMHIHTHAPTHVSMHTHTCTPKHQCKSNNSNRNKWSLWMQALARTKATHMKNGVYTCNTSKHTSIHSQTHTMTIIHTSTHALWFHLLR